MHAALPQTLTVENLAQWLTNNRADIIQSKGTKVITPEERAEYEHISSDCSQKLDELEEIKKAFNEAINGGTFDAEVDEENGKIITIPATIGVKKLTEERKRVDKLLRDGYTSEKTTLYLIPWPEEKLMIAFDIEGQEWGEFSRDMREDEINQYRTLFETTPVGGPTTESDDFKDTTEELFPQEIIPVEPERVEIAPPKRRTRRAATDQEPII